MCFNRRRKRVKIIASEKKNIQSLSRDVLQHMFQFLESYELLPVCKQVCRVWNTLSTSSLITNLTIFKPEIKTLDHVEFPKLTKISFVFDTSIRHYLDILKSLRTQPAQLSLITSNLNKWFSDNDNESIYQLLKHAHETKTKISTNIVAFNYTRFHYYDDPETKFRSSFVSIAMSDGDLQRTVPKWWNSLESLTLYVSVYMGGWDVDYRHIYQLEEWVMETQISKVYFQTSTYFKSTLEDFCEKTKVGYKRQSLDWRQKITLFEFPISIELDQIPSRVQELKRNFSNLDNLILTSYREYGHFSLDKCRDIQQDIAKSQGIWVKFIKFSDKRRIEIC